jgi:hypothetical protein
LLPICLGLAASQNISVELSAEFIQTVDLCAFCENSQTVEILHNHLDAIVRLFSRSFSLCGFAQKNQFAGIFDTGPSVHVRQSDMWMR